MQQLSLDWEPSARVRIARGPMAGEEQLLAEIESLVAAGLEGLAKPVLLVVPSATLRRHLLERILTRQERGAIAGLDCRTHLGLAATLLENAAGSPGGASRLGGIDLFSLFARRLARRQRALEQSLEHLTDGYGAVLGAVRDLLDAGFDPALADGLDETLASEGRGAASGQELRRARALVEVAAGTLTEMERWGLGRSSDLLREAALLVRGRPLEARRVLVYGFNDATGLTIDFLLALLRTYGGSVYLDHPPDPAERRRADPGLAFSRNFRERIETAIPVVEILDAESAPPRLELFRALGGEAEVREVAYRIRRLLESGTRPERIGVVVRRLDEYVGPLRTQLGRLAVPFSSDERVGPYAPRAASLHAVLQLLREGARVPLERWLDAATLTPGWSQRADLLLALHTLGAGRLAEAAALDLAAVEERGGLALPARRGFVEIEDPPGAYRASRRRVGPEVLGRAVEAAARVRDELAGWPRRASAEEHTKRLERLLSHALGWQPGKPPWRDPHDALMGVAEALPPDLEIDFDELQSLLSRELSDFGRTPLGGAGGGVRILGVTAARSLTFDHLFVLGLNRGVFPRQVREDPILSDPLRQVLGRSGFGVLPDLPVKRNGFHEERYLFAQLLSASPRVTLSWQDVDDQQKNLKAVSPLVERLGAAAAAKPAAEEIETPVARPVFSPGPDLANAPRPLYEAAVLTGLSGDRDAFRRVLELALPLDGDDDEEARAQLATARTAVLDEADPNLDRNPEALGRLGPWLGRVGEIEPAGDPRPRSDLFVTALERLAKCPWQHFLQRVLRVEQLPDPLEAVPGIDPLLVGLVVHDALEGIVEAALGEEDLGWEEALASGGRQVPWPAPEETNRILRLKATALVRARDLGLPGLDRALVLAAAPHLETARGEDWPGDTSCWPVVATEVEGFFEVPDGGAGRRVHFRADRMDRTEEGFSFTDYKTGRWAPQGSPSATAGERLLAGVRAGEWLQAAAYAMAGTGKPTRGRYLYLSPAYEDAAGREYAVHSGQAVLVENFAHAVASILDAWDHGTLFPRLFDLKEREPRICSFCEVSDACVRGDSGARRRLGELIESWQAETDTPPHASALLAAWNLARPAARRKSNA